MTNLAELCQAINLEVMYWIIFGNLRPQTPENERKLRETIYEVCEKWEFDFETMQGHLRK